jgi:hypothetical protein
MTDSLRTKLVEAGLKPCDRLDVYDFIQLTLSAKAIRTIVATADSSTNATADSSTNATASPTDDTRQLAEPPAEAAADHAAT